MTRKRNYTIEVVKIDSGPYKGYTNIRFRTKSQKKLTALKNVRPTLYEIGAIVSSVCQGENHHPLRVIGGIDHFRDFLMKCTHIEPSQVRTYHDFLVHEFGINNG